MRKYRNEFQRRTYFEKDDVHPLRGDGVVIRGMGKDTKTKGDTVKGIRPCV